MPISLSRLCAAALVFAAGAACAQQPATVRVDYLHSGNALHDQYALERVVIEPLAWPGDLTQALDNTNRGQNRVEVVDGHGDAVAAGGGHPLGRLLDRLGPVVLGAVRPCRAPGAVHGRPRLAQRDRRPAPGPASRARNKRHLPLQCHATKF